MFSRPGLNLKGARLWNVWARVAVVDGRRSGWAQILEFGSGDLAWYSKRAEFLIWGLRARIHGRMAFRGGYPGGLLPWDLPQSRISDRPVDPRP